MIKPCFIKLNLLTAPYGVSGQELSLSFALAGDNEEALLQAAAAASPGRILVKRPVKGPWLCGIKPAFTLAGKAIRYDCLLPPYPR